MKARLAAGVILIAALALAAFWPGRKAQRGVPSEEITVLAAASLADALPPIGRAFEEARGTRTRFDFAASGVLAAKIEAGARADVFVSASPKELDRLRAAGRISESDRCDVASNQLVCVQQRSSLFSIHKPNDLISPEVRRIAIGDPAYVPAGEYAREALEHLALWDRLQPRLVPSANVRASLAQVESGAADAAIVYQTDAAISSAVRIAFQFPQNSHSPIRYPAAALADAPHRAAARSFLDFLRSQRAAAILSAYGFSPSSAQPEVAGAAGKGQSQAYWRDSSSEALRLSLRVSLVATLLMAALGAPIALWLARRKRALNAAAEGVLLLPLVLPPVVTGYILLFLFSPQSLLGRLLELAGVRFALDWKGAVLAAVVLAFPLFLAVAKAAFEKADPTLEAAARTLNASRWRVLLTVTLPPALPGLAAAAALAFARAFGEFGATMMFAGNIPGQTRTVPQAIYTHLVTGDTPAAWGLIGFSALVGVGAMAGAWILLKMRPAARLERSDHA